MGGKPHLWLAIFFVFIIALSGCGGSSGGGGSNGDGDNTNPPINNEKDTIAPSIPTDLTATPVSESQIDLSWNASTDNIGVVGYKLYRDGTYIKSITESTTSDNGLNTSVEYCYTVSAYDKAENESEQSSEVCAVASTPFWIKISEIGDGGNTNEQLECTSNGFIFWWEPTTLYGNLGPDSVGMPLKRSADGGASWIDALSPVNGAMIYGFKEPQNGYFFTITHKGQGWFRECNRKQ